MNIKVVFGEDRNYFFFFSATFNPFVEKKKKTVQVCLIHLFSYTLKEISSSN